MITRLEATRYRCFERLAVDVGDFRVLVGANGSGKTTLLDLPVLLGDLMRADYVAAAFMERRPDLPPRAGSLNELIFAERGSDFSFAVEACLPEAVQAKVLEGQFARKRTDRARQVLRDDPRQWLTHIRYELGFRIDSGQSLQVAYEYLFLFPQAAGPDRQQAGFHGAIADNKKHWHLILKRELGYESEFKPETPHAPPVKIGLPDTLLALPRVGYETEAGYPAARWLLGLLTKDTVFLNPDWSAMRQASPPGLPKGVIASARNLPWLALELKREGAPDDAGADYRSGRFGRWIAHVQTALPQITDIDVRTRADDHHTYFVVRYKGGFNVSSSGLSDGTLRILTLTLLPYLGKQPAIVVTEEPENGIHPRAIEAVLQSLSSLYDSQVWVSSHSPVVLAHVELKQLLCARQVGDGGVQMVSGDEHPRLKEWRGGIDLGSLFAAGVLG